MIKRNWSNFRITSHLNVAAALMTCDVRVLAMSTMDVAHPTRETIKEFHLLPGRPLPPSVIPAEDPHLVRARFNLFTGPNLAQAIDLGPLRRHLEDDTLEAGDPEHCALDALRGLEARECLLSFMNRARRYRIQVHPTAPRAKYVEGQEPLASRLGQKGFETWSTRDTGMAAAMARVGCPVIHIAGEPPHRSYILPRFGHALPGRPGPEDALELYRAMQLQVDPEHPQFGGELGRQCPEHPCVWVYGAIKARLMIRQQLESKDSPTRQVFLHLKNSTAWRKKGRSALIEERSPSKAEENAVNFLRGKK